MFVLILPYTSVERDPSKNLLFPIRDPKANRTTAVFFRNACFSVSNVPFCVFQMLHNTDVFRSFSVMTYKTQNSALNQQQRPASAIRTRHLLIRPLHCAISRSGTYPYDLPIKRPFQWPEIISTRKQKRAQLISKTSTLTSTITNKRVFFQTPRSFRRTEQKI